MRGGGFPPLSRCRTNGCPTWHRDSLSTMDATFVAVALSVAGGLFELAGLALVVAEINHDREQAKRLFVPRSRRKRPRRSYPAKAIPRRHIGFPSSLLGGVSYGGRSDQRRIAEALAQSVSNIDAAAGSTDRASVFRPSPQHTRRKRVLPPDRTRLGSSRFPPRRGAYPDATSSRIGPTPLPTLGEPGPSLRLRLETQP